MICEPPPLTRSNRGRRFTLDGSEALESRLEETCQRVLEGVRALVPDEKLDGLVLGGGYGRGEGGVLSTPSGDLPYNDLEFYVFVRGNNLLNERGYRRALHQLGEELSSDAGVEIEFKVLSLSKLRRNPTTMYFYDLVTAHRWIRGDDRLLAGCERHSDPTNIPMSEAARLMMNRCAGLLFARERLRQDHFTSDDADFVGRNIAKAQLAFGDAVLAALGQYHWSCRERHRLLEQLAAIKNFCWMPDVLENHAIGVKFKLRPQRSTASRLLLLEEHEKVSSLGLQVWLWLENMRLRYDFKSAFDYALSSINKCPETNPCRNLGMNLLQFRSACLSVRKLVRHPRETLFNSLPLLLWEHGARAVLESPSGRNVEPGAAERGEADSVRAFKRLWAQFN